MYLISQIKILSYPQSFTFKKKKQQPVLEHKELVRPLRHPKVHRFHIRPGRLSVPGKHGMVEVEIGKSRKPIILSPGLFLRWRFFVFFVGCFFLIQTSSIGSFEVKSLSRR